MTARSLTGNFSKFGTYYLYKLRTMRSMIILNSIFALLSYPLAFGILIPYVGIHKEMELIRIQTQYGSSQRLQELTAQSRSLESLFIAAVIIGIIMLGAIFVMNFVVTNKAFRWLYKKSIVDMDYSLPVSGDTRFCGDLLVTLSTCLVPHLIAIFTGMLLWKCVPFGDSIYSSTGSVNSLYETLDSMIPQLMFTGFAACVMLIALTLFIMSLCGRAAESGLYPAVFNVIIPIVISVCIGIVITNTYGAVDSVYGLSGETLNSYTAVAFTSPLGLLICTLIYAVDTSSWAVDDVVFNAPLFRPEIMIPLIIITLVLLAGAYFLIRNRRAERVGNAFVYKAMKFVIPALVIFSIVASFSTYILSRLFPNHAANAYWSGGYYASPYTEDAAGYIIAMLIITFVLYVIMELISGKGFKKFHITLLKYVVTVAGSFLICMGLFFSNGFGAAYRVPNASDVVSVGVNIYDNSTEFGGGVSGVVKLPENIEAIVDIHRDIPKNGPETDGYDYSFFVSYTLKDGTSLYRHYFLTEERYNDACEKLFSTELYANYHFGSLILDIPTEGTSEYTSLYTEMGGEIELHIPAEELRAALLKDCEKLTPELMYDPTKRGPSEYIELRRTDTVGDRMTGITTGLNLYSWYDNTIALLESYGITGLLRVDTSEYAVAYLAKIDTATDELYSKLYYYDINAWRLAAGEEGDKTDLRKGTDVVALPLDHDIINELYENSFVEYYSTYSEDTVYKLVLSTGDTNAYPVKTCFISEDYIDRAEEIFAANK